MSKPKNPALSALEVRPVEGWPAAQLAWLDPKGDLLGSLTTASVLRRQTVFLCFALMQRDGIHALAARLRERADEKIEDDAWMVAHALRWRVRDLLEVVLETVPDGIYVALARVGVNPMPHSASYLKLLSLLQGRFGEERAQQIHQAEHIDGMLIDAAIGIDPTAPNSNSSEMLPSMSDAIPSDPAKELRMLQIQDAGFQTIAWIDTAPSGRKTLFDAGFRPLGYYDPATNRTLDAQFQFVGIGDLLMTLLSE